MPLTYIIIAVLLWASNFVGIRAALVEYSPIDIAVLRFIISSIVLLLIAIPEKIKFPGNRDWLLFVLIGFVLFINMISLNYGMRTITAGETNLIVSTSQPFQVLIAWLFLKENISKQFLIGLFFCFSGIVIIAFQYSFGFSLNTGVIFVLIAAITIAIFFVSQKYLLEKYTPFEVVSYGTWIATLLMLPLSRNVINTIPIVSTSITITVIYLAIASLGANLCWAKALSKIDASKAAIFLYTIPVVTIIMGFLWLHELPSLISCIGGIIILGGVFIANVNPECKITKQGIIIIENVKTTADAAELDKILWQVLWHPLGFPRDIRHNFSIDGEKIELIVKDKGKVFGGLVAVWINDTEIELRHLAVASNAQKNGIGYSLVNELFRIATLKGCYRIHTIARNTSTGFFKKLGFQTAEGLAPEHEVFLKHGITFELMKKTMNR